MTYSYMDGVIFHEVFLAYRDGVLIVGYAVACESSFLACDIKADCVGFALQSWEYILFHNQIKLTERVCSIES